MIRLAILLLRPFEAWHAARIRRAYRTGKYKYLPEQGNQCVTTKQKVS